MSSRIELHGVGQTFLVRGDDDRKLRDFVALHELDLDIRAGEFLSVVGPRYGRLVPGLRAALAEAAPEVQWPAVNNTRS